MVWLWLALTAGAVEFQWVQADVLNLRLDPRMESPALAQARIGTGVEVVESQGSWRRVRLLGRPSDHPVEGWVEGSFLGGRVDARDLWRQVEEATEADLAVTLAERALALDGSDSSRWDELAELRQHVGDLAGAAASRARAAGDVPMWVGVCDGERVELVGRLEPGGELGLKVAAAPLDELASASWFTGDRPMVGTPFATPFLTHAWNQTEPNPWSPSPTAEGDPVVVLGPCSSPGLVYSTLPISPRQPRAASVRDAANFLDELPQASTIYGLRVRRPMADDAAIEIQLVAPMSWYTCGGFDETRSMATGLALLDSEEHASLRFGGPWFDEGRGDSPVSVSDPRWFTTLGGQRLLVTGADWNLAQGVSVAVEGAEGWAIHHQILESWGC